MLKKPRPRFLMMSFSLVAMLLLDSQRLWRGFILVFFVDHLCWYTSERWNVDR